LPPVNFRLNVVAIQSLPAEQLFFHIHGKVTGILTTTSDEGSGRIPIESIQTA